MNINVRCLSLWQPWASAVAFGSKAIETRSWWTSYRGPILIHAARKVPTLKERESLSVNPAWRGALCRLTGPLGLHDSIREGRRFVDEVLLRLPYGEVVAVATLENVIPTDDLLAGQVSRLPHLSEPQARAWGQSLRWSELDMGDYRDGRFAWVLGDVREVSPGIPIRASQGLFNVDVGDGRFPNWVQGYCMEHM